MRLLSERSILPALVALAAFLSACSAPTRTVSTVPGSGYEGAGFNNILVIGVANDYEGRAMFERKLAAQLRSSLVKASAYYSVVGGNKPIDRESIEELVNAEGYDAVLISRVLNRESDASTKTGSAGAKAIRKDGRPINLFRYDYEELNEPMLLNIDLTVTLSTELFEATDKQNVWAIESTISDKDMLEDLIDEAVERIVKRLRRDRLIGS